MQDRIRWMDRLTATISERLRDVQALNWNGLYGYGEYIRSTFGVHMEYIQRHERAFPQRSDPLAHPAAIMQDGAVLEPGTFLVSADSSHHQSSSS